MWSGLDCVVTMAMLGPGMCSAHYVKHWKWVIKERKIPRKDRLVRDREVRTVFWKRKDSGWA